MVTGDEAISFRNVIVAVDVAIPFRNVMVTVDDAIPYRNVMVTGDEVSPFRNVMVPVSCRVCSTCLGYFLYIKSSTFNSNKMFSIIYLRNNCILLISLVRIYPLISLEAPRVSRTVYRYVDRVGPLLHITGLRY